MAGKSATKGKSLYYTIMESLEAKIALGEYSIGAQLPPEFKLAEEFKVSRGTIRQALKELELAGIISRQSGVGTTVLHIPPKENRIVSMTKQIKDRGMNPTTIVESAQMLTAGQTDIAVRHELLAEPGLTETTEVYRINRLRCGDGKSLAHQMVYLIASQFKMDILETVDFTHSLYGLYAENRRWVVRAREVIRARLAASSEIEQFGMKDSPLEQQIVYVRDRVSYDQNGDMLEVLHSIERADFFGGYGYEIREAVGVAAVDGAATTR